MTKCRADFAAAFTLLTVLYKHLSVFPMSFAAWTSKIVNNRSILKEIINNPDENNPDVNLLSTEKLLCH